MWRIFQARLQQGHRTMKYPDGPAPPLPDRFRGRPVLDAARCEVNCTACIDACPTDALSRALEPDVPMGGRPPLFMATPMGTSAVSLGPSPASAGSSGPSSGGPTDPAAALRGPSLPFPPNPDSLLRLDLGRCIFCTTCVESCPTGAMTHDHQEYRLAVRERDALHIDPAAPIEVASATLSDTLRRLFGRSLKLRQVSAGGCNACEADTNVLGTVGWDLSRFGIQFVASPRHADGLFITGPVSTHMELALQKTWEAVPTPKIVIATGACAISGGLFRGHPEARDGAIGQVPVDLFIPGCPPHPLTILDGLLRMLGRLEADPTRLAAPSRP